MSVIDDYLNKFNPAIKSELERIRGIAKKMVPEATEVISYGIPTFQYQGKSFLGFNVYKNHISIFPFGGEEIEVFKDELSEFSLSKGTIRVPLDQKFPENILKKIIDHRIKRIAG